MSNYFSPDPALAAAIQQLVPKAKPLGDREFRVLHLTAQGLDTGKIADKMGTSIKTADNQRQAIYRKLRVGNAVQASRIYWAAQQRLGVFLAEAKP